MTRFACIAITLLLGVVPLAACSDDPGEAFKQGQKAVNAGEFHILWNSLSRPLKEKLHGERQQIVGGMDLLLKAANTEGVEARKWARAYTEATGIRSAQELNALGDRQFFETHLKGAIAVSDKFDRQGLFPAIDIRLLRQGVVRRVAISGAVGTVEVKVHLNGGAWRETGFDFAREDEQWKFNSLGG